jgi:hypothetical protein
MSNDLLPYIKNLEKRLDESNGAIRKLESAIKNDLSTGKITFAGKMEPSQNATHDIGSVQRFIKDLYLSGKIIYPDVLDFGINNDFCINQMGKVGFHTKTNMDGVSIKGLPSFTIQGAMYIGEMTFIIQISGAIENYITILDIAVIDSVPLQIIEINGDKITVRPFDEKSVVIFEPNKLYNLVIHNTILGVLDANHKSIMKIDALGNLFYNTTNRKADITLNGSVHFEQGAHFKEMTVESPKIIMNMNAEFVGGKRAPLDGEIVGSKDKQQLWNKSFGNDVSVGMNRIRDMNDPVADTDAVNKRYIDRYLSGLRIAKPVAFSIRVAGGKYVDSRIQVEEGRFEKGVRYILMNQENPAENGVYIGVDEFSIERASDFCSRIGSDELRMYYTFIEDMGVGVCFNCVDEFEWDRSPIYFNTFSKTESYTNGAGLKKENNQFSVVVNPEVFDIGENGLELKVGSLDNKYIRNNYIHLIGESGIDISKSVIHHGENARVGLKVNRKQFHFGKNGELELSSGGQTEKVEFGDTITAVKAFQNVHQLFPPKKIFVEFQYSDDNIGGENVIQYYVCSLDAEGKATNCRKSDEYHYGDEASSVFANVEWEIVDNCYGYKVYRRINRNFQCITVGKTDLSVLDILAPKHFTKIEWVDCEAPDDVNRTVFIVNTVGSGGSFFNGGGVGIGTEKAGSALHVVGNQVNSRGDSSVVLVEGGDENRDLLHLYRRGIKGGAKIVGETADGKSSIEMGRNMRVVVEDEGVVFLGRRDDMADINYKMGSDSFSVQAGDGGIYASGDMMCGGAFATFNNRIGNNGAVLKTGCIGNSIGNEVGFLWEGDGLFAIPFNNGAPAVKKRVGVKNFTIQHPIHADRYLVHACLEGPTADVFYRGVGRIEYGDDSTDIELPEYFSRVVEKESYTIHITPRGKPVGILGADIVGGNILRVCSDRIYGIDLEFYWQVIGKRAGTDFESEPRKGDVVVQGFGPYTYLI